MAYAPIASNDWNETKIINLLNCSDRAVEKALVALYKCQTEQEQKNSTTTDVNNVGFSVRDVRRGSYYANWILAGKRLTGIHLEKAREIAKRYRRQLSLIANGNQVVPEISAPRQRYNARRR